MFGIDIFGVVIGINNIIVWLKEKKRVCVNYSVLFFGYFNFENFDILFLCYCDMINKFYRENVIFYLVFFCNNKFKGLVLK